MIKVGRVLTPRWKKLDIQRDTSDLNKALRDWFFEIWFYFVDCPQTDLINDTKFPNSPNVQGPSSGPLFQWNTIKNPPRRSQKRAPFRILCIPVRIARVEHHPTCVYASSIHACISLKCELSVRNMIKHSHSLRLRDVIILQNRKRNHVFESWNFPLVTAMKKLVSFSNSDFSDHDYFG